MDLIVNKPVRSSARRTEASGSATASQLFDRAVLLHHLACRDQALATYERVLAVEPDNLAARNNVAVLYKQNGDLVRAEHVFRSILHVDGDNVCAWNNLGNTLKEQGRVPEALEAFANVLVRDRLNHAADSNFLLALNYDLRQTPQQIFDHHLAWGKTHCRRLERASDPPSWRQTLPIRVGYVSADFRQHSMANFLQSILSSHDRSRFGVYCYSAASQIDAVTDWFRGLPVGWRDVSTLDDFEMASVIRRDRIQILVDCSGHTAGNRLRAFALRPAPVQVTYAGYPNTTGLMDIDFRLTDRWADPYDTPTVSTETLVRIDGGFLCYQLPDALPKVNALPALRNGFLTFASFGALSKLNPAVVDLWSRLLTVVPDSRLLLKARGLNDASVASRLRGRFGANKISDHRIDMLPPDDSTHAHLSHYHQADLALDTFPYNGTATIFEALSMGVPVLTVAGDSHAGRVGSSILHGLGLGSCVASTSEQFVEVGKWWSRRTHTLSRLRYTLRGLLVRHHDAPSFTRKLEAIYLQMVRGEIRPGGGESTRS